MSSVRIFDKTFKLVHVDLIELSVDFLQVPSLDEILESMIRTLHGPKAVKNWDKRKQLFTQPLKQIEKLAFQEQVAARMGIISVLYLQNALASLSSSIKSDNTNPDILQSVNDIFAISMKSLDQFGRTGAFNHMIRRKAAASESGLNTLKDIQAKVLYLPLWHSPLKVFLVKGSRIS